MDYKITDENRVSIRHSIHNEARFSTHAPIPRLVQTDMARELAETITQKKIKVSEDDKYVTTYSLELYVFTPGEFYRAVRDQAREYMYWTGGNPIAIPPPPASTG